MKNNSQKVIFFFYPGRSKRLSLIDNISKEFFYSFIEAKEIFENVQLIEVENTKNTHQKIMKFYDRVIFKISRIQSNSEKYCDKKYKNLFKENNILVFTNFALGLSALPFLLKNMFKKNNDIFVINSGLFSFRKTNFIQKIFRTIYLKIFFNLVTKIIFTSKTEYSFAVENFNKYFNKFKLIEFCPDHSFWSQEDTSLRKGRKGILFVGNDEGRCFELLEPLAIELKDYQFTYITNNESIKKINLPNVKTISGKWSGNNLSDLELLEIYRKSKIAILPIQDKLVASGQSVALQSMCNKTPVMITNTKGFWNRDLFKNEKNIIFVKNNTVKSWASQLIKFYDDEVVLNEIAEQAYNTVEKNYRKEKFDTEFLKLFS